MGAIISETELRIILSHVCDYDVIKLDGELPRVKKKISDLPPSQTWGRSLNRQTRSEGVRNVQTIKNT